MLLQAAGMLAADGALPINIRIVSDGEEEVGGQSIVRFLEQDERGADACVIFDGGMEHRGLPSLAIATRGLAARSTCASVPASATSIRACTGTRP